MKSSKQPKEKGEPASIQGSISKSPNGGKKSCKSSGGQHQKRAAGKDVVSILGRVLPQHGDCNADEGSSLGTVKQMPLDIKPANEKTLPSSKIKLQLFPVDEAVRMGLEKDGHNPFLELTLSARKKITSVLKHLCNKWGSSSIAMGELMLFPFNSAAENLMSCRKWTLSDIGISAGDVYAVLGNPEIFRLRYGWVSCRPNNYPSHCTKLCHVENISCRTMEDTFSNRIEAEETGKELESRNGNEFTDMAVRPPASSEPHLQVVHKNQDEVISKNAPAEPFKHEESRLDTSISMTSLLWSDLSNISIGGLLSEASLQGTFNTEVPRSGGSRLASQPTADSLDAFIEQYKYPQASTPIPPDMPSSILDAESTCHSFAFLKSSSSSKDLPPTLGRSAFSGISDHNTASESLKHPKSEVHVQGGVTGVFGSNNNVQEPKTDPLPCSLGVYNNENSLGLSSIRWNDSLGPFDLHLTSRQTIKDDNLSIGGFVR